ncbi:MAG: OadG family protein [Lentimicrobium sp.]|nr:OadG family protein [Lentimicrobium sp.]
MAGAFIVLVLVLAAGRSNAQSIADLRINEILVINDSNYVDSYGQRNGWIEIFNTAYNTVDIGGLYLTNDMTNPTKYRIPTGDPLTKIAPRNYLLFFADGMPTRGIQHLNFTLTETNYIALFEGNGKTMIDAVMFDEQTPDISYGRIKDGGAKWGFLDKTTPGSNNFTADVITSSDKFLIMDPYGVGMAVIAMSVVFGALILLYILFKNTKKIYGIDLKTLFARKPKETIPEIAAREETSGEVNAAIAMSLHLYISELHDHEDAVLTIKKVARTYSPWSSKIYGLRNWNR